MKIIDLLKTLRFISWENGYRAILYAIIRDRQDAAMKRRKEKVRINWQSPGTLLSVSPTSHGAEFEFEEALLEILFLDQQVVRVSWQPGEPPVPYAIQDRYWPGAKTNLAENETGWVIQTESVSAMIGPTGDIEWKHDGNLVRREAEPLSNKVSWRQLSPLPDLCAVYGLGGRTTGLNLRGGSYRLWNRDPGGSYSRTDDPLYLTIPTMLILQDRCAYVVFYENSFDGQVTIDDQISVEFDGGMLRYYLCFGNLPEALERYCDLTGKPTMPPIWALGFHQSRWGYRSAEDIRSVINGFREHELPLSAIHLDIDHMDGYRVFTTDPHRFPDLKSLSEEANAQDIKLVAIVDPGVKIDRGYHLYREGLQSNYFSKFENETVVRAPVWPGWVHFPDFTHPGTRNWWREKYPRLIKQGVSGFWHDMNEPAAFAAWGDPSLPISTHHALEGKGGHHSQAHNLYGLLMNRAGWEALSEHRPARRPFLLSRSGWAGNQRFAWNWTGDVESSWEGLRVSLALMLGMGLSGISYTGSDIGGFSGNPSPELLLRWMQLAVFTPFFRIHSAVTSNPREPWRFAEPFRRAMREMLQLRVRLMPYLYTLAWRTSKTGLPMMRPLFWLQPSDPHYWDIEDTFLLGSDLLIAPVLERGIEKREIVLPHGQWYSLWDDTTYRGPGRIEVQAPLEEIPVFVRGGSVLPLNGEDLELHLYPGDAGEDVSLLYCDSGDGFGPYRIDSFQLIQDEDSVRIERRSEGEYPFPHPFYEIVLHGEVPKTILIDGKPQDPASTRIKAAEFKHLEIGWSPP